MKEFVSHIDCLIKKYDCVIIPDFGGFVLSRNEASFASDGSVFPPKVTIGFNPDLKYNDGLLAESYMNMYSLSYDEACKRIGESVKRLQTMLDMDHPVKIGQLGKLTLTKDKRLLFTPNSDLTMIHPETFGLTVIQIKRLSDIEKEIIQRRHNGTVKRLLVGVGSVAAAVLVFFLASTPIEESPNTHKSSFMSDLVALTTNISQEAQASELLDPKTSETSSNTVVSASAAVSKQAVSPPKKIDTETIIRTSQSKSETLPAKKDEDKYFVIIGSSPSASAAQMFLSNFKKQGLSNLNILKSGNKNRIYVASFSNRSEADKYITIFKSRHIGFDDAWVYAKK